MSDPPGEAREEEGTRDTPDRRPALAADLATLARSGVRVPRERGDAIRAQIHRHFDEPARRRRVFTRQVASWCTAAAAVLAVFVWLGGPWNRQRAGGPAGPGSTVAPSPLAVRDPADVNRNGRVDILDAMALARQLEGNAGIDPLLDLNGDGGVDGADVDVIALRAVALDGRTG